MRQRPVRRAIALGASDERETGVSAAEIAACAGAVAVLSAQGGQRTFRSGVDIVTFGVTVVDKKGNYLTDLVGGRLRGVRGRAEAGRCSFFVPCDAQPGRDGGDARARRNCTSARCSTSAAAWTTTCTSPAARRSGSWIRCRRPAISRWSTSTPRCASRATASRSSAAWWNGSGAGRPGGTPRCGTRPGVYLDGASRQEGRKILVLYTDGGDNAQQPLVRRPDRTC